LLTGRFRTIVHAPFRPLRSSHRLRSQVRPKGDLLLTADRVEQHGKARMAGACLASLRKSSELLVMTMRSSAIA
jgi:hypothetical protein